MKLVAETLAEYLNRLWDEEGLKGVGTGTGANSVVFEHPTDKSVVVKLSIDDPIYMSFVRFCRRNQTNRWLPHIFDVQRIALTSEPDREVWAVFVPRLKHATERQVMDAFSTEIAPWTDLKVFSRRTRLSYPQWRYVLLMTEDEDLRALVTFLMRNFRYLDLGTRNFMTREGGQLVFNDPLADRI